MNIYYCPWHLGKNQLPTSYYMYMYIHIIEIPTNKGANSYILKIWKIGNWYELIEML